MVACNAKYEDLGFCKHVSESYQQTIKKGTLNLMYLLDLTHTARTFLILLIYSYKHFWFLRIYSVKKFLLLLLIIEYFVSKIKICHTNTLSVSPFKILTVK